jgi:hypothetical protein
MTSKEKFVSDVKNFLKDIEKAVRRPAKVKIAIHLFCYIVENQEALPLRRYSKFVQVLINKCVELQADGIEFDEYVLETLYDIGKNLGPEYLKIKLKKYPAPICCNIEPKKYSDKKIASMMVKILKTYKQNNNG